jgi:hypothetical protein
MAWLDFVINDPFWLDQSAMVSCRHRVQLECEACLAQCGVLRRVGFSLTDCLNGRGKLGDLFRFHAQHRAQRLNHPELG